MGYQRRVHGEFQLTRKMTNKYSITDSNNNSSKNPVSDNAESISSMSSILDNEVAHQIDDLLSSDEDSDYDITYEGIRNQIMLPDKHEFIMIRHDAYSLEKTILASSTYKNVYEKSPGFLRYAITLVYQIYCKVWNYVKKRFSVLGILLFCYRLMAYLVALGIHQLNMVSDIWRITISNCLRIVLKSDQLISRVLKDRDLKDKYG